MKTTLSIAVLAITSASLSAVSLAAQIPMSDFVRTYSYASHTRGFFFQAPVNFIVTGLQVPDETNAGVQSVAIYRTSADPTTLPLSVSPRRW